MDWSHVALHQVRDRPEYEAVPLKCALVGELLRHDDDAVVSPTTGHFTLRPIDLGSDGLSDRIGGESPNATGPTIARTDRSADELEATGPVISMS